MTCQDLFRDYLPAQILKHDWDPMLMPPDSTGMTRWCIHKKSAPLQFKGACSAPAGYRAAPQLIVLHQAQRSHAMTCFCRLQLVALLLPNDDFHRSCSAPCLSPLTLENDSGPTCNAMLQGDYVIKLMLRHDDAALLGKMKALPVLVERSLAQSIDVPVYPTNSDSVRQMKPLKDERVLAAGDRCSLHIP